MAGPSRTRAGQAGINRRRLLRGWLAGGAALTVWGAYLFFSDGGDPAPVNDRGEKEKVVAAGRTLGAASEDGWVEAAGPASANGGLIGEPLRALTEVDPMVARLSGRIVSALQAGDGNEREQALESLLPALVELNPDAASRLALNWEAGPMRQELLRRITHAWLEIDTLAAIRWLGTLSDINDRQSAATDAANALAQTDPASAIEVAEAFGVGREDGTLQHLAQLWAAENVEAALSWVRARPAGEARDLLMGRIVLVQAESDPVKAAAVVVQEMSPGEARDEALISVVHQWAVRDSAGALEWVERFPVGELRDRAKAEITGAGSIPLN